MKILEFHESDGFESDGFDDHENSPAPKESSKPFLLKAIASFLAVTGITYGANIALTSSTGSGALEFGQGSRVTATCDSNGITVIPYTGFINEIGTGKFTLDSIILEDIDQNCFGKDFIIQVFADTGAALTVSETATAGVYTQYDVARFYYQDSATVVSVDSGYTDFDVLTDTSDATEVSSGNSVQITFDPDQTISFADASQVRKITLQTVSHGS
jgi:hypothetical protein